MTQCVAQTSLMFAGDAKHSAVRAALRSVVEVYFVEIGAPVVFLNFSCPAVGSSNLQWRTVSDISLQPGERVDGQYVPVERRILFNVALLTGMRDLDRGPSNSLLAIFEKLFRRDNYSFLEIRRELWDQVRWRHFTKSESNTDGFCSSQQQLVMRYSNSSQQQLKFTAYCFLLLSLQFSPNYWPCDAHWSTD